MSTGVFLMVLVSACLHAGWNFAARKASGNLCAMWLGMWAAGLCCLPFAIVSGPSVEALGDALPYMLATGVIHSFYFVLLGRAYATGEISFVYPTARGSGVAATAVAAALVLGERVSTVGGLGIAAVSLGVLAMGLRAFANSLDRRAALYSLSVGLTMVFYSLVDKVGVSKINPVAYIAALFLLSSLLATPYVLVRHRAEIRGAWRDYKPHIVAIGPGSLVTYLLILFALQSARVSYVFALRECSVAIGAVMGRVLLAERSSKLRWAGIVAIVVGVALVRMAK